MGEEIRDWQSSDPDVIERVRELEALLRATRESRDTFCENAEFFMARNEELKEQIIRLQAASGAWRRQCEREEKHIEQRERIAELEATLKSHLHSLAYQNERIKELEAENRSLKKRYCEYSPDYMAMGDCKHCGRTADDPIHKK